MYVSVCMYKGEREEDEVVTQLYISIPLCARIAKGGRLENLNRSELVRAELGILIAELFNPVPYSTQPVKIPYQPPQHSIYRH